MVGFNRVYPPIAKATSLAEAVFLDHLLYMWLIRTGEAEDSPYAFTRRPGFGIYIYPAKFCQDTGISTSQFRSIVKNYEDRGILRTRIDQSMGNRKYYRLKIKMLREYLREKLSDVWSEVVQC